jgi:hypothetical protein
MDVSDYLQATLYRVHSIGKFRRTEKQNMSDIHATDTAYHDGQFIQE